MFCLELPNICLGIPRKEVCQFVCRVRIVSFSVPKKRNLRTKSKNKAMAGQVFINEIVKASFDLRRSKSKRLTNIYLIVFINQVEKLLRNCIYKKSDMQRTKK